MVSSFKEKFKNQTSKAQNKCIHFCLNFAPRSHIDSLNFREINWPPVSDRVEYCIAKRFFKYWNGIVLACMKSFSLHFADKAQDHRWHWVCLCGKQIQGKKAYLL